MGVYWNPCNTSYYRSKANASRNFYLNNVAVTRMPAKHGGASGCPSGGGRATPKPATKPDAPNQTATPPPKGGAKAPSQQSYDRALMKDLVRAADTGRGITKPELADIVETHARSAKRTGVLPKTQRQALLNAHRRELFGSAKAAQLGLTVGQGGHLSLLNILTS